MQMAAIYTRVSSNQQREAQTIASQTAALVEWAATLDLEVPQQWIFEDEGYSGATLERPGLEQVRDLAAAGDIQVVLVHGPDRLSRKYAYQVLLIEELGRHGVETRFLNGPSNAPAEDQLLVQFQGMIAEYERAQILERSRRGKLHRARAGEISVLGGAPYGYRYLRKRDDHPAAYVVIDAEARVVRDVYEHYTVTGWSIAAVTRWLNEQGVPTRKADTRWERSTVWAMLRNPAYRGTACFGKTRRAQRQRVTRPLRLRGGAASRDSANHERPREEWIEIPVPAIVDEPTFARAQELLQENKVHAPRRTIEPSLVQGLVSCQKCGYALSRASARTSARKIHYYRCIGSDGWRHLGGPRCDTRPVRQDLLDEVVWTEVIRLLEDPALIQQELDRRLAAAQAADPTKTRTQAVERDLAQVGKSMERLLTAYQEDLVSLEQLRERMPLLRQREQTLRHELNALVEHTRERAAHLRLAETLSAFLTRLRAVAETLDIVERQRIVRLVVKEVLVNDDTIVIRHCIPVPSGPPPTTGGGPNNDADNAADSRSYLLRSGSNRRPLRGPLPLATRPVREAAAAVTVVFLPGHFQPRLDPAQQPPVAHASGDGPEQFRVRDLTEVVRQIRVYHLPVARVQQPVHAPDRVMRAPARPVRILFRWQVGLEDRRQHQHRRRLHHPVPETRNAQRSELPALLLRDEDLPNRTRTVGPLLQVPRQCSQPPVHPERLDVRHRLAVHPGRAAVATHGLPGDHEHVVAPHLVAQRVEPEARSFLRFRM